MYPDEEVQMIQVDLRTMSPEKALEELLYISYAFNRDAAPHIKPEQYVKVYGEEVWSLEARYQAEKALEKAMS
jgi:hypothetical protein